MIPLVIPPGVFSVPTMGKREVRWSEANLMRWVGGRLCPIKGQEVVAYGSPFASRVRAIHQWESNSGVPYTAYLCEGHLYVDTGGTLYDVSPDDPIVPPYSDVSAGGYGMGLHGAGRFGTPRPPRSREKKITPAYTLRNWGETLLAMTSMDGRLLQWTPSDMMEPAVVVDNAPVSNRTFSVTSERHVILYGMGGDFRKFGWCDQEDINNWDFANVASKAGFFAVEPSSPIVAAHEVSGGAVFFTAVSPYVIRHVGLPFVYSYENIPGATAPVSSSSVVTVGDRTIWMSESGWWQFDGISISPLQCDVWDHIANDINWVYSRYESVAVDIVTNSEIHFFYVSANSRYNDRLAIYNYRDGWWSTGKMSRSCGFGSSYTNYPIMSDGQSVYQHEKGIAYPGISEGPWIKSFSVNPTNDGRVSTVTKLLPDYVGDPTSVRFRLETSLRRGNTVPPKITPSMPIKANGFVDLRSTGIEHRLIVESALPMGGDWTLGDPLIDLRARGMR